ncbi:hypothetical protein P8Q44_11010 [Bacillus pumilus]|uniref:hypothetical protein n=1 Tax=Bacillus pumilus TaxID=1408 RepID=UPI0024154CB0|nr:hypothetical protein [Bacillus pumilus]MDG4728807.1 hypothetical protein [Bacillus pumilus]
MHGEEKKTSSSQEVSNKATDLRAALDQLFSEHAYLAVITMQKGIDGSKDFDQAAAALNDNTNDLSDAIASVYGKKAGKQFKDIWSSHIGYFVDYVKADASGDKEAKEKAVKNLDAYRMKQAKFLDQATDGRLKAADLEAGLKMHIDELIKTYTSYHNGEYDQLYPTVREAYGHMFMVGQDVAAAIVDQHPELFKSNMPNEMPKTGMGGTAGPLGMSYEAFAGMIASLILAGGAAGAFFLTRRKTSN